MGRGGCSLAVSNVPRVRSPSCDTGVQSLLTALSTLSFAALRLGPIAATMPAAAASTTMMARLP